jgi:two-component system, chemotaxis family, chemotaxis protein CheV
MSDLIQKVDARTKLAGTNKLEILLFSLGLNESTQRREVFGINVFKVREVMCAPEITHAPETPPAIEGMVSLRGILIPVVDLAKYIGISVAEKPGIMIVTEYNGHVQGFLVQSLDTILRVDWAAMKVPPSMMAGNMGGVVTAVTELGDGRLAMMLDVEKVLSEINPEDEDRLRFTQQIKPLEGLERTVFFVDDSAVARKQIQQTLDAMHVKHISAVNGKQAWAELLKLADYADSTKRPMHDLVQAILTDVEMPEMDGYMLTRNVKSDPRFHDIPMIMHSSLSAASNEQLGKSSGADEYVPKFEPRRLAETLTRLLA